MPDLMNTVLQDAWLQSIRLRTVLTISSGKKIPVRVQAVHQDL
jgi:hypothetical protein